MESRQKIKQLVEVVWLDPSGNEMKMGDLENATADSKDSLNQFLVKTRCYGWIVKEDMDTILLGYSEDASGLVKFKTIPKPLTCGLLIPYYRKDNINLIDYYRKNRSVSKKRRLVEVVWLGSKTAWVNVSDCEKFTGGFLRDLLPMNYSYGVVFSEDEDVVILKQFENNIGWRETQIISRKVIQRITPFYQSGRTNSVVGHTWEVVEDSEEQLVLTKEDGDKMDLDELV